LSLAKKAMLDLGLMTLMFRPAMLFACPLTAPDCCSQQGVTIPYKNNIFLSERPASLSFADARAGRYLA